MTEQTPTEMRAQPKIKIEHDLPNEPYNRAHVKNLLREIMNVGTPLNYNYKNMFDYINKYFYKKCDGKGYFYYKVDYKYNEELQKVYKHCQFEHIDDKQFKSKVLDLFLDPDLRLTNACRTHIASYFKSTSRCYNYVNELGKPRHYSINDIYYVNESARFLYEKYKQYDEYDDKCKEGVQLVLSFIKEIISSDDEKIYNAYLKYLAMIARGKKTKVITVFKTIQQGVGKSTWTTFLMDYVLGNDLCIISGTEPLTGTYNKCLMGKLFVIFEEMPAFGTNDWNKASSALKTLSTESTSSFRGMYHEAIQSSQVLNFHINTNVIVKDSNGRRMIPLDFNCGKERNYDYFGKFRSTCYNYEVGEAFFSYLRTMISIEDFIPEQDFPDTENKKIAMANQLQIVYQFLKDEYVLKRKGIDKIKCADLYDLFVLFCRKKSRGHDIVTGKVEFYRQLEAINIKKMDSKNSPFYRVSMEELVLTATRKNWICKYDDFIDPDMEDLDDEENDTNKKYIEQIKRLQKKIIELELIIESHDNANTNKVIDVVEEIKQVEQVTTQVEEIKQVEQVITQVEEIKQVEQGITQINEIEPIEEKKRNKKTKKQVIDVIETINNFKDDDCFVDCNDEKQAIPNEHDEIKQQIAKLEDEIQKMAFGNYCDNDVLNQKTSELQKLKGLLPKDDKKKSKKNKKDIEQKEIVIPDAIPAPINVKQPKSEKKIESNKRNRITLDECVIKDVGKYKF